ncbi:hypothetical protein [Gallaecimonas sp. GXIMD4217]|uniref:hypothetical protein n=1 Tax=Gallaecimonas sp. GXIMD4217 TaxID=3131927 RepID=UPI00311B37D3
MTTAAKHRPSLDNLFTRLRALDKKLVTSNAKKQLLPEWWEPGLKKSPSAAQQAIISIARTLNLEMSSVLDPAQELRLKDFSCQYKKSKNTRDADLAVATSIIHSAATTAIEAIRSDFRPLPPASELRKMLLDDSHPWVDFELLIEVCWKHGIPVLHMPSLPVSKKMDAVVVDVNGRPAIALTKNQQQSSWLLFHLAHEMGHVSLGHLQPGQTLIDEKISEDEVGSDVQEQEADLYALELLTGSSTRRYMSDRGMKPQQLADEARRLGTESMVAPGHIVLNWAFAMHRSSTNSSRAIWGTANTALKHLYPKPNWRNRLHKLIEDNLDDEKVTESDIDNLFRLTGVDC